MAETKKIIHIETATVSNVSSRQLAVETGVDADLGYRMWGGKDGQGAVTKWLAKDKKARVTDLTISGIAGGGPGVLKHDNSGVVTGLASLTALTDVVVSSPTDDQILQYNTSLSQWENSNLDLNALSDVAVTTPSNGQILQYNTSTSKWENVTASSSASTLDQAYDAQSAVERAITMDDGNVAWYLDDSAAQFKIVFTANGEGNDGFYVLGDDSEYFRVIRYNDEGQLTIRVQSDAVRYDLNCTRFIVISDDGVTITAGSTASYTAASGMTLTSTTGAADIGTFGSGSDLTLRARGISINLNQLGNINLTNFTATSIIGALNEVKSDGLLFKAPSYTTTERDALSAQNGMIIYNTTTARIQGYSNGTWQDIGDIT